MIFDLKFKTKLMFNFKYNLIPSDKHNRIGADGQPYNTFKFTKGKTAADTEGSECKDSSQRSGDGAEKRILGKELRVYILEKKTENHACLAPDLRALSRQGASLSRHTEILGKEHLNTVNRTLVSPEVSDEASPIGSRISTKTE